MTDYKKLFHWQTGQTTFSRMNAKVLTHTDTHLKKQYRHHSLHSLGRDNKTKTNE